MNKGASGVHHREYMSCSQLVWSYYGRFLPDLATLLSPLYSLLNRLTTWRWGHSQQETFRKVKELVKSERVLVHLDDQLPLVL